MNYKKVLGSRRVQLLVVALAIALLLVGLKGLNFGIEFRGGVRIPITIISEKGVTSDVMAQTVDTLKQRINKYGLSQSVVRPLGDREIIVEIPRADESVIQSVQRIISEQGRFEALIDGKAALEGTHVLQNAVGGPTGERIVPRDGGYSWELDFVVDREGSERFAKVALGKANYPVYMTLDRPESAAIIIPKAQFNFSADAGPMEKAMLDALRKDGASIELIYAETLEAERAKLQGKTEVIISKTEFDDGKIISVLKSEGFSGEADAAKRIVVREDGEMVPETYSTRLGVTVVSKWPAIGLLSAPSLSEGLAGGTPSQFYSITGSVTGAGPDEARRNALAEIRELKSVISGGRLPVSTSIGSAYVVAPSLGEQFLSYSWMGILVAILAVSGIIVLRYRRLSLAGPIVVISALEIFLTSTVIGVFGTLDLAAVAGIIGIIGTGVADQIIITDEMLRGGRVEEQQHRNAKERIAKAFYIVFAVAGAISAAMLPLFLSGIVEVMGFALSTIVGVVIGISITRPAFSAIVEEIG